jgi:exodeoxyribonuclease V beta subunit
VTATFQLVGPLPTERVAIEASAGTGKTFTLAGLATREVVEAGVPIDDLLVVTFTRAAAGELRDRVRRRLVEAEAALADEAAHPTDELLAHLVAVPDLERQRRLERVRVAISGFDAATITTIHGFATQVLSTLGSAAPGDPDAALADDDRQLVAQACADVLAAAALALTGPDAGAGLTADDAEAGRLGQVLRAARQAQLAEAAEAADAAEPSAPTAEGLLPTAATLAKIARQVLGNPSIEVVPPDDVALVGPLAAARRALVDAVVDNVRRHRRAVGTLSYDEILTQVRDALHGPEGPRIAAALRRRFQVALIDEFQDTDPVQWDIFARLFDEPGGSGALVLVGDPKQAIYAFRGANVHTYLAAAHQGEVTRHTLATNWRSDGALLDALGTLLDGTTFGDPRIEFLPVAPADHHRERRLLDDHGRPLPAIALRTATGPDLGRTKPRGGKPAKLPADRARQVVADDLAAHLHRLLDHGRLPADEPGPDAPLDPGLGGDVTPPGTRRVRPDDIAVLVRNHSHALPVKRALDLRGIPAVINRAGSVATSPAAAQLRLLLHAVSRPAGVGTARALALSWFFDWPARRLDAATEAEVAELHQQLHEWSERLSQDSFAAFAAAVRADTDVVARRLAQPDGDRDVTDLDHLVELLHAATGGRPTSAAGVLAVLDDLATDDDETDREVLERRVESDARAVQILTIHASKGLEFPIVCCPSLFEPRPKDSTFASLYQDPATGRRTIDVANDAWWPDRDAAEHRRQLAQADQRGEDLRLAYVALTRARHHLAVWWASTGESPRSPLAQVLFCRDGDGLVDPVLLAEGTPDLPLDEDVPDRLAPVLARAGDTIELTVLGHGPPPALERWTPHDDEAPAALDVAVLGRSLDRSRARWSFTAISTQDRDRDLDPYDEVGGDAGAADEPLDPTPAEAGAVPASAGGAAVGDPAPTFGEAPGSAELGTLVHAVLEVVDFTAPDLDAALGRAITELAGVDDWPVDPDVVRAGLGDVVATPLGPLFAGRRLRDLPRADRLDELAFELRLGDHGPAATMADVGGLVLDHLAPGDPLRPWAAGVADGRFPVALAGHLTGSIDAVLRVPAGPGGTGHRYVVVDYKTNVLGPRDRPARLSDYRPEALPEAMAHHHYPLQALLYLVALHRYLRWRLPGYRPEQHLGGAGYLFLRGMAGPGTPTVDGHPHGVFAWEVPPQLVVELSALLHGRGGAA